MAKTEHYFTEFEAERYYHVYNRTVDSSLLFANTDNYRFFLEKFDEYLSDYVKTYAYCLLGNHFHWLLEVQSEKHIREKIGQFEMQNPERILAIKQDKPHKSVHEIVSHQFRKFFQSYAMAFNKQQERYGTLFQTPFKRALVDNEQYFTNLIAYIHTNPQKHGIIKDFRHYEWSSYQRITIEKPTKLQKNAVLEWFGGRDSYWQFHEGTKSISIPDSWKLD